MKKKLLALLLAALLAFSLLPQTALRTHATEPMKVVLVADVGGVEDGGFNQQIHDKVSAWCAANSVAYATVVQDGTYDEFGDDAGFEAAKTAVETKGATVVLLPGFMFADAAVRASAAYPNVTFLIFDVDEYSLRETSGNDEWVMPENLYAAVYREEQAGFLAGWAAVKLGYENLGFLGGPSYPGIIRYGYGFLQGVDAAAAALNKTDVVKVNYVYTGQFAPNDEMINFVRGWYQSGTEIVFACGGGIYVSAAVAASATGGKIIGVDADQAALIDGDFGAGMTVTSAVKELGATAVTQLNNLKNNAFTGGICETLGIVSADPAQNHVGLAASTQFASGFTAADYGTLLSAIAGGTVAISDGFTTAPHTRIRVNRYAYPDGSMPEYLTVGGERFRLNHGTWFYGSDNADDPLNAYVVVARNGDNYYALTNSGGLGTAALTLTNGELSGAATVLRKNGETSAYEDPSGAPLTMFVNTEPDTPTAQIRFASPAAQDVWDYIDFGGDAERRVYTGAGVWMRDWNFNNRQLCFLVYDGGFRASDLQNVSAPYPDGWELYVYQRECAHEHCTLYPAREPDCLNYGNSAYYVCDDCGLLLDGQQEIYTFRTQDGGTCDSYFEFTDFYLCPPLGHAYSAETGVCSRCGAKAPVYEKITNVGQLVAGRRYLIVNEQSGNALDFDRPTAANGVYTIPEMQAKPTATVLLADGTRTVYGTGGAAFYLQDAPAIGATSAAPIGEIRNSDDYPAREYIVDFEGHFSLEEDYSWVYPNPLYFFDKNLALRNWDMEALIDGPLSPEELAAMNEDERAAYDSHIEEYRQRCGLTFTFLQMGDVGMRFFDGMHPIEYNDGTGYKFTLRDEWIAEDVYPMGEDGNYIYDQGEVVESPTGLTLWREVGSAALVTDGSPAEDGGFNQAVFDAATAWCSTNGISFETYQTESTEFFPTDADYERAMQRAIDEGATTLLLPGSSFAGAAKVLAQHNPGVAIILLDAAEDDLRDGNGQIPGNLYAAAYREEQAGFLAGWAAVSLGYENLGFLGGMAVPGVVRYGLGFVQGANAAAAAMNKTGAVKVDYVYSGQFWGDKDLTAFVKNWYANGTQIVFACGGGVSASAGEAAQQYHGKLIGVDLDQAAMLDEDYGAGITVTSAVKALGATTTALLNRLRDGTFRGGRGEVFGVVSSDPEENHVGLGSTQFGPGFTEADYRTLLRGIANGAVAISDETDNVPDAAIDVVYHCYPDAAHDWDDMEYTWNDDNTAVYATQTCEHCGLTVRRAETTAITRSDAVEDGADSGVRTYTATFADPAFQTQTKTVSIFRIQIAGWIENGTVAAEAFGEVGEAVALTVTPANGYQLETLEVDLDGEDVETEKQSDTLYTFLMPDEPVDVYAWFRERTLGITSHSISLKDEIGVNFYVSLPPAYNEENTTVICSWDGGSSTGTLVPVAEQGANYFVSCDVDPRHMIDGVTVTLTSGGEPIKTDTYSAVDYAVQAGAYFADRGDLRQTLCDMLDYGGAVQTFFGYKTDDLASDYIPSVDGNWARAAKPERLPNATSIPGDTVFARFGLQFRYTTMLATAQTAIRLYFEVTDQAAFEGTTAACADRPLDFHTKNGLVYLEIGGISAKNIFDPYTVTLTKTAAGDSVSLVYSAADYYNRVQAAQGMEALQTVLWTMHNYSASAAALLNP